MEISFSNSSKADKKAEKILQKNSFVESKVNIEQDRITELSNAVKILVGKAGFVQNIKIDNKKQQRKQFKNAREHNKGFSPDFSFEKYQYNKDNFLKIMKNLKTESTKINEEDLNKFNFQYLDANDFQNFFQDIINEIELYVRLASGIEDRDVWKNKSLKIWPMVDESTVKNSKQRLVDLKESKEDFEDTKKLHAEDLKIMWEKELSRLNIEYNVEVRKTGGCFNIPEESTVVVAKGKDTERLYSKSEAEILTMHELFHVVRAYNGFNVGKNNGFPPILGLHTPFYDKTEEGGAIYREHKTGVITPEKEFDYHLRLLAAYYHYKDWHFQDIVEELISLGGSVNRSFYLGVRNREALRHHIYQGGYYEEWKDRKDIWPLLIGKVNPDYASLFKNEVQKGVLNKPCVGKKELFEFTP